MVSRLYYRHMTTITALFIAASTQFNLPAGILESLCYVESKHNIMAIHQDDGGSNSVGICQVKLTTARWLGFEGSEEELMLPENNIFYAAAYLSYQQRRYADITRAVVAYNRGNAMGLTSSDYSNKVITQWGLFKHERH